MSHARAMLLGRNLPKCLCAKAVNYATWLKNRLPSQAIPDQTPYRLVHGTKPNLSLAREFGAPCLVHVGDAGKLDARAEQAIFVGIDAESKAYRVYWARKRKVSVERNVTFPPTSVEVADDVPAEGESTAPGPSNINVQSTSPANRQLTSPKPPSTLTRTPQPAETPPAPRATRTTPPPVLCISP